ncbi:MAG: hypothetical protein B7X83_00425 [Polynucleobacter sp. 17-46-58]|jgi:hypothetical protein|nr:MAG: hypothetical protein B7Y22_00015 [Polynucleobacter sp. 16-46-70]OZA42129.1 MAG: hypothetical protein B7X83_00425 [Polynucleobacter sp. 17-46-58]OZB49248.1 MAG: hypothetical protein B7X60_01715 [Polynucleobacter sp. 39-45-136]HQR83409.1 hypothetical protein [Polynucleobacter sp.]HQS60098.1 hypothetical protein [Polynucleobacter sp.]
MVASFLSKNSKQFRGWIVLGFLLASLIGTHWVGFAHSINHSGIHAQNIELSCHDQNPNAQHGSATCHLLDALTLAGFIASDSNPFIGTKPANQTLNASDSSRAERIHVELYQSRAPPSFTL